MARGLKFCIWEVEGLYYPCSENRGADQLCSYCTADMCLCFRICKSRFSHDAAQINELSSMIAINQDIHALEVLVLGVIFK